jgi:hypothetical protein
MTDTQKNTNKELLVHIIFDSRFMPEDSLKYTVEEGESILRKYIAWQYSHGCGENEALTKLNHLWTESP